MAALFFHVGLADRFRRAGAPDETSQHHQRHGVGHHLEKLHREADADHLQTDAQRIGEAEKQSRAECADGRPLAEDHRRQRDETGAARHAIVEAAGRLQREPDAGQSSDHAAGEDIDPARAIDVDAKQEIFGPLLPVVSYQTIDEAIDFINDRDRPLALYLCSHDKALQKKVLEQTHAGGVCINDAAMHVAQEDLPFGGVGPSGMGHYHGPEGFMTFSKAKSVFQKGKFNSAVQAFPPYGKLIHKLIYKFFLR